MNPIVRRELLDWLRTRKAVAALALIGAAAAALVLARWPSAGVGDLNGAAALQVLRVFGYGMLACLILVLPAFPATSVVRERVKGTLALLLNSPMSPRSIYLGKLGGALGFVGLLLAVTVPAAAACFPLGGSTMSGGVGLLYVVLAMAGVQVTTVGLYVSCRTMSVDGALRTTYAAVLALCVLPLAAHYLTPPDTPELALVAAWVGCLSPVPAVMEAVGQSGAGIAGVTYPAGAVGRYVIVAGMTGLLLGMATVMRLSRAPLDRPRPPGTMTQDRSRGGRAARRLFFLVDPNRRSAGVSLWVNAVMVKEFRTRRLGRAYWVIRLVAVTAVLSVALSCLAASGALNWGLEVIGGALVLLQAALLVLFAPSLSAGLISAERERGGWNLLRLTPLSAGKILRGKLASAAIPVLLLTLATMPGYVVLMMVKPELAALVPRVVMTLGLTAVFAVLVGAAAGSIFRTTAAATAAAYVSLALICVAPFLVWLGRDAPFGYSTVTAALRINPVAAALHAADTPGFDQYPLLPVNWWIIGAGCVLLWVFLEARVRQLRRPD